MKGSKLAKGAQRGQIIDRQPSLRCMVLRVEGSRVTLLSGGTALEGALLVSCTEEAWVKGAHAWPGY